MLGESQVWLAALTGFYGVLGTLVGAMLTHWQGEQRDQKKQLDQYIEQKQKDLYAPLLALCFEAEAKLAAYSAAVADKYDALEKRNEPSFEPGILADSGRYKAHLPSLELAFVSHLKAMRTLLRDKLWLAEEPTRTLFGTLVERIEMLELNSDDTMIGSDAILDMEAFLSELADHLSLVETNLSQKLTVVIKNDHTVPRVEQKG